MESKIILHESRDKSLKRKHPWIFSKAIKEVINEPVMVPTLTYMIVTTTF